MLAWNAFILTKWAITFCSGTEKFRTVNFASHDRVCDNRIKHLIRLWSLIVLSIKVSNLPFWKFDREWAVGMVQAGMTHQAVVDHFNVSRITISRLMICLRKTDRMNDRPRSGRPRVTSQRQDRYLRLIILPSCYIYLLAP